MAPLDFDMARFGILHDAQYESSGQRLATASEDGVVRIWNSEQHDLLMELRAHKAAVLLIAWAGRGLHASLVSGAADGSVVIWREDKHGQWNAVHHFFVKGPATAVSFCPREYGLLMAVSGGDRGEVCIINRKEVTASPLLPSGEQWISKGFMAHDDGIIALSWAPSACPATLAAGPAAARAAARGPRRIVTASTSRSVKVWRCDDKTDTWSEQQ
eukprot:CAMPEP_0197630950 /NCGR_PEP_ID=MMETSP1338-20131121/8281_1 /TAXON_ID=43686 ORGANISM="Pelagodinium beii, Strain RCC1491" /NCGR_SAMPLE_ID=MMETSP1338 /ASSEMBLY_ACC=CAM_ASM_000754 /LENGTH=214 /DNA_ID=CAMNT_0043202305 /DNA_START=89 /DNA_END=730 /DNA_ORIENTATION=+